MTHEEAYLPEHLYTELVNRLHRMEGHMRGVAEMIERREPCDRVLVQLVAVKSALNRVMARLLEGHMESCLAEGDGEELERLKKSVALFLRHS
jgi:DNA-binding FrmR family transcriptional regulator